MSEPGFTQAESTGGKLGLWAANRRLLLSLPLFLKFLPLSFVLIFLSSAAPSYFRWYAGSLAESPGDHVVPYVGRVVTLSALGLVGVAMLALIFRIGAWAAFEISGMWSAQGIHRRMVHGLGRVRTTFFDENPSGRLINRLVRDYDEVRSTAIIFIGDLLNAMTEIASVGVVAAMVSPWAGLMVLLLFFAFYLIHWYRAGMLEHVRGLTAVATSRVIARKTDLVEGREIFQLYGKSRRILERMAESYREYVRASILHFMVETWSGFWVRFSAELFAFAVLLLLSYLLSQGAIDIPLAGVIISALFGIRGSIGWLDFATTLIARSAPHVRRVFEFVDLPSEETEERLTPLMVAPAALPASGDLRFVNYTMSYRKDTPVILEDLNLWIREGSKTALIGRTGSGKTSVLQALFRMVYVRSGDLRLGGRSVFSAPANELRLRFGVVPQSPYLFAGTLRSNLDRFGLVADSALATAMEAVGLDIPLDQAIREGGQNLSVGERQLICLARIIATNRPFILMDEPTSGMDTETDARIGKVLSSALADRTLLTIAHRRESLGTYDRVVEMAAGRVIWEGSPRELERRERAATLPSPGI